MKRFLLKFVRGNNVLLFPAKYFKNVKKLHLLRIHLNGKIYEFHDVQLKRHLGNTKYFLLSRKVFKKEDLEKAPDYIFVEVEYF